MIAPAAFSRCTASASTSAFQSLSFGSPQVVGSPAMLNCSFTVIGRPSSGRPLPLAGVGGIGGGAGTVEIAHDDSVNLAVERLDAVNRGIDQLARGDLPVDERFHQLAGAAIGLGG